MLGRGKFLAFGLLSVFVCAVPSGCEALHNAGVPGLEQYVKKDPEQLAREKSYKENYALHRDHKSFYWLLSHRISNGMSLADVEDAIGEEGESTTEFTRLKSDGLYHSTDAAYRWGPDSSGHSAVIFFRDGHVVNFSRDDYKVPKSPIPDDQ